MMLTLRCKNFVSVLVLSLGTTTLVHAQSSANQALDSCMQTRTVQGAVVGGIAGAVFGNLVGGNNNRGRNTIIGGGIGAAAGGAIAWQNSVKSCMQSLNLASVASLQTSDYRDTAQRYNYNGNGVVLNIEGVSVPPSVIGGQTLSADLKYALLTPDVQETAVQVDRAYRCGNTVIPVTTERYTVSPGTIVSPGNVPIASLSNSVGQQSCSMWMRVAAAGLTKEWQANFVILPNQP